MRFEVAALPLVLCLIALPLAAQDDQGERLLDEIVAKVNQDVVTMTDLEKELRLLRLTLQEEIKDPTQLEEAFQRRKRGLLKSLIQNRLMLQKAEELGLTANVDGEVNQALEQMRQQMGIPSLEVLEQLLEQRGTNLREYRENLKEQMVTSWLIQQSVYSKITLLTPEIEEYYRSNPEQFTEPARVTLAEIVFLSEGKTADQLRILAEEAHGRLESGIPFEEVAADYSDGPTAARGGSIGDFKEGSLAEQVESAISQLEPGQHTDVIETDYGLVIFKVLSREERQVKPMEEVGDQIRQRLYQSKAQPELKEFLEDLIEQSYIYVAPKYKEIYDVEDLTG